MKNTQKGFVVPLLILIIILLIVGGGYYIYSQKRSDMSQVNTSIVGNQIGVTSWKKYNDNNTGFSFSVDYPSDYASSTIGNDKGYSANNYSSYIISFNPVNDLNHELSVMVTNNTPMTVDKEVSSLLGVAKVAGTNAVATQEPNIIVDGVSASVVKLGSGKGDSGTHVIFQKGNTLYELIVGSLGNNFESSVAEHFFNSFKTVSD